MLKKGMALFMALLLATALLGGCSSASNTPAASATPAPTTAGESPAETETTETTPAPEEATPAPTQAASQMPWAGDPITFKVFAADVGVKEDPNGQVCQVYKKAVGNITLDWELVPFSDFDTKGNIYLNSGEIPDLMWNRVSNLMPFLATGSNLFVDLNTYATLMPNWAKASQENTGIQMYKTDDGKNFMFCNYDNDYPAEAWFCNKTELDKLGIAIPTTLEDFEAACQKIKESDPEVMPFITFWNTGYYMQAMSTALNSSAGGGIFFDMTDKKWKFALNEPSAKYKDTVALVADYYKKGYFNQEMATMPDDTVKQIINSNKWAFTYTYDEQIDAWYSGATSGSGNMFMTFPIDVQPMLPPAPAGSKPKTYPTYISDQPGWAYVVGVKNAHPDVACAMLDTLFGDAISTAFQWGIEGTSYTVDSNGKKQWIPSFFESSPTAKADLGIWNILFPRYITKRDDRSIILSDSKVAQASRTLNVGAVKNGTMDCYYPRLSPTFTDEENNEISAIMTTVNTKMDEGRGKFTIGQRDMSEWDAFVKEVNDAGNIARALEIYNNAKQKPDRVPSSERTYVEP